MDRESMIRLNLLPPKRRIQLETRFRRGRLDTLRERFLKKVVVSETCWGWNGALWGRQSCKYGEIDQQMAHRVSWELFVGPIPKGKLVLHACDNPPCTRPDHLFLGTHMDNMQDKIRKGRDTRGEKVNTARLSPEQITTIRSAYALGRTQTLLAEDFSVGQPHISSIIRRAAWKHIP
jgi:hypothetical protein